MSKVEYTKKIPAKKAVPAKTKKMTKTVCDFCDKTVPDHGSYGWYPHCSICQRDTCRDHNKIEPYDYSDYPDWFCEICYDLRFNEHQEKYLDMINRHDEEKEAFMNKLKEESLGIKSK